MTVNTERRQAQVFFSRKAPKTAEPVKPICAPDDATPEEMAFFAAFEKALTAAKKPVHYQCSRMANKAVSVKTSCAQLGKIKLQGKKTWMQYMTGLYDAATAEDQTLDVYISLLKYWVKIA